jgi:hypothetical protein
MSDIPYNYRKYIDDVTKMTQRGHVSSGEQQASPSSAGSRGLAKTTQFTNNKTQMQLGQEAIAESMVEIRNIMNRIDGVNVPVSEAESDERAIAQMKTDRDSDYLYLRGKEIDQGSIMYKMEDYSDGILELQSAKYADGTELDEKELEELESTQELIDWVMIDFVSESAVEEDSGALASLKELSGIEADTNDDLMQWVKKYSQYKNLEDDNLIEALYDFAFDLGITQFIFEVGELQAAEQKLGKKQEDWEDAEINAAMEMSPISNGLIDDLHRILPGNAELEQKLDSIRGQLEKAGLKEDKYQPMPEGDEFDIAEDEDFEEVLGPLGFPEDETELFDAEYQGRKVPLNKPMRGDSKKFKVYVKDPKTGNVKKVNFGHGGTSAKKLGQKTMKIRKSNPKARKSFRARHNCANPGPKTKARYWSCRKW